MTAAEPFELHDLVRVLATDEVGRVGYASTQLVIVWFGEDRSVADCFKPEQLERLAPEAGTDG